MAPPTPEDPLASLAFSLRVAVSEQPRSKRNKLVLTQCGQGPDQDRTRSCSVPPHDGTVGVLFRLIGSLISRQVTQNAAVPRLGGAVREFLAELLEVTVPLWRCGRRRAQR